MELKVGTIRLLPWWDTDKEVLRKYLKKIESAIRMIGDYYGKNILFIDNCSVLPLTYVLKYLAEKGTGYETSYKRFERGIIVFSDEYAVILLNDEEYEEDYIEELEACFIIEPLKALDP